MKTLLQLASILLVSPPLFAQWVNVPPPQVPRTPDGKPNLTAPAPWRIIQTPRIVFFVHEAFNLWWQAFMDGRQFAPHPDVSPTWHGYSTARWEGDTLVVDMRLQRQGVARSAGKALHRARSRGTASSERT